jgi:hypothetical protein
VDGGWNNDNDQDVRAILRSEPEGPILARKTKELIIRVKTRDGLLSCKGKPKRIL